jgi:hypothetical protein
MSGGFMRKVYLFILLMAFTATALADWKIDLTRRQKDLQRLDLEQMAAEEKKQGPLEQIFEKEMPKEEVVIANTDKGFVPNVLRLKKDQIYQVSVVNVNKNKKNVSFMLDAFAEHHGTYFGDVVTFTVKPQKEGLFQFYCPEAEFIGKVLVYSPEEMLQPVPAIHVRQPAQQIEDPVPPAIIRGGDE